MSLHSEAAPLSPAHNFQPAAILGSGRLVSVLRKFGDEKCGWNYTFNIFWTCPNSGEVRQLFSPNDLLQLVKLIRVLAFELVEEGCLPQAEHDVLDCLRSGLDAVINRGGEFDACLLPVRGGLSGAVRRVLQYARDCSALVPSADHSQLVGDIERLQHWSGRAEPHLQEAVAVVDETTGAVREQQ